MEVSELRQYLLQGQVIPALPLTLDADGKWSQRHERALIRYYFDAGAGGLAVGVHSTQFEIREPEHALLEPVLSLATDEVASLRRKSARKFCLIAGVCGRTDQAIQEANIATRLGFDAALLSLAAWKHDDVAVIVAHCREVSCHIPLVGFYLQPAVGGRTLSYEFWSQFAEIENVVGVKIAPFNRYQTIDVVRAVTNGGRDDIALYTGNDDNIILDLLTTWEFNGRRRFISGGLLGQFGVWTERAVAMLNEIKAARGQEQLPREWLSRNTALTDVNAAIFDPANNFHGCLSGIHEVLRRQGLMPSIRCLNPKESLSPGQADEITRVTRAYPWLVDDTFVAKHRDRWLDD
jgi:dihydrodipicolinate synthase/N-acetylneuraminate lyase